MTLLARLILIAAPIVATGAAQNQTPFFNAISHDAAPQVLYSVRDLGPNTGAVALNSVGTIVGGYYYAALLWRFGQMEYLNVALYAWPTSVNNLNVVAGYAGGNAMSGGITRAWSWSKDRQGQEHVTWMPVLTNSNVFGGSNEAFGINDFGSTVGVSDFGNASFNRAFVWRPSTSSKELPPLPGYDSSAAAAINDWEHIVGQSYVYGTSMATAAAVIWKNDKPQALPGLEGCTNETPTAISNLDIVVGAATCNGQTHAVIWNPRPRNLGVLTNNTYTRLTGVNIFNTAVGFANQTTPVAVLWTASRGLVDLNTLLSPADQAAWHLEIAYAINDLGHIVGKGLMKDGFYHAFELTPKLGFGPIW